MSKIVFIS